MYSDVFTVIMFVLNLYISSKVSRETETLITIMETKIINIGKIISSSMELHNYFGNDFFGSLDLVFQEFKKVKHNYNDNGFIIVFYKKLKDFYEKLTVYLKFIGNVDYYTSLAKLLKNSNYNLVSYEKHSTPFIFMKEFSHPYLHETGETVVKNDILLGLKDSPQNMILTGPNAGGKSTLIKSILVNIVLAQTLGISFSSKLFFTPFRHLECIMNIQDTKGELSYFESEITKINNYIESLDSNSNNHSLVIIDELCSGTNIIEGSKISYYIANYLGKHKNNIALITTHLNSLSQLPNDSFKNYKMDIEFNDDDSIHYTYKLRTGISNVKLAVHVLKRLGMKDEIIRELI